MAVGGCASSTGTALSRVHAAEQNYDQAEREADQALSEMRVYQDACDAVWADPCAPLLKQKAAAAMAAVDRLKAANTALERAERDLDFASEESDRRAARGAAMIGAGAAILGGPPRNPVTCTTSDTTNPTTICR